VWPSFVTLVLALLGILLGGCLMGGFFIHPEPGKPLDPARLMSEPWFLIGSAAISQVALLLAVWKLPGAFKDVGPAGWRERVQWRPERFHLVDVLVTALGTMTVGAVALALLSLASIQGGLLAGMSNVARTTEPSGFAWLLLFGAIAPGFAEELAFRGLLQSRLVERWGVTAGIVISSMVFGAYHFDLRQGLMAMTMGLWLGWCAHRQRSIVNVAFAHAFNNAFAFTLSRLGSADETNHPATTPVALVLFVLCAWVMWSRTRPQQ
jgi:membrane protease YdiL (CAAX protease family)